MTASAFPSVSVVVVARNEERRIGACIASIAAQDYPDFDVTLIDDGSTDETIAAALAKLPSIKVISSPTRSISRNRDIGWRAARGEYVAYLDADCTASCGWLSSLVRAAQRTDAAAIGGGNRPPAGISAHYTALALMLDTFAGSRDSIQGRVPKAGRFVPHLPGLNVMYRRDALELVDGYDPRFARMGEDEDLSRRLGYLGLRLYVASDANVIHHQRADLLSWARNMRAYGRGRTWLMRRHPNTASPLFLLPQMILPLLPLYLGVIFAYAGWVSVRNGHALLWPRLFALFMATHLPYGLGQIEGLFIRGDGEKAAHRRNRVALLALKNAGNKGDEAILACVSQRMCKALASSDEPIDLYLGAIGPSGFDIRPAPHGSHARDLMIADMLGPSNSSRNVGLSAFEALPRLIAVVTRFRAMVIAGGQWLHDLSFAKHLAVCTILAAARLCRTRTGVFCIGAGPLRRKISHLLLRIAFSRRSILITRDEASTSLLRACGFTQAQTASDPAIELQHVALPGERGRILVSPCAWSSFENIYALDGKEIDVSLAGWRQLVGDLIARGERIAVLPTMNPEDTEFSRHLVKGFPDIEIIDTDRLTPAQVQGCIASAQALISMRLHPVIFASNAGTPFVALTYADKVRAYCTQMEMADRLVDPSTDGWARQVMEVLERAGNAEAARAARSRQSKLVSDAYSTFLDWLLLPGTRPSSCTVQQTA